MRLIDGDEFEKDINKCFRYNNTALIDNYEVLHRLNNAPTIDAVEVVRCKDCKFNYANQIPGGDGCQLCEELPISKDFFCAYGEKMDEEGIK